MGPEPTLRHRGGALLQPPFGDPAALDADPVEPGEHGPPAFVEPGQLEFQLQSVVEHTYEMEGAQFLGFSTILAWGPNTTVLHYGSNDQQIQETGLVLIDTGAAWEHYSADVTRTIPVSGTFSAREKELYELVLRTSNAAIRQVKPGADYYNDVHMTAKKVLDDAGYGQYFIHGTGHFLGLDVHDAGNLRVDGSPLALEPGMTFTIEPGLYVAPDRQGVEFTKLAVDPIERLERRLLLGAAEAGRLEAEEAEGAETITFEVPEAFRGIGVRIEDDVLITSDGRIVLSEGIPRSADAIEAWVSGR